MADTMTDEASESKWSATLPQVRRALRFIKSRGARGVTAEELRDWDAAHGRTLFDWNNQEAADAWRIHQARLFLNRFRGVFEGMRVRAHIFIHEDAEQHIDRGAYRTVDVIAADRGMRAQVVADITKRMATLASELTMWKLTAAERASLLARISEALTGEKATAAA